MSDNTTLLFQLRTCGDKRFALRIAGKLLEVLDEPAGKVFRSPVPLGRVGISIARVENCRVYARECGRHRKVEIRNLLGRGLVYRAVEDGVDDAACIPDGDTNILEVKPGEIIKRQCQFIVNSVPDSIKALV